MASRKQVYLSDITARQVDELEKTLKAQGVSLSSWFADQVEAAVERKTRKPKTRKPKTRKPKAAAVEQETQEKAG